MSWGIFLIIMGIGTFVLPHFGLQFKLISLLGSFGPFAAILAIVGGAGLIFYDRSSAAEEHE